MPRPKKPSREEIIQERLNSYEAELDNIRERKGRLLEREEELVSLIEQVKEDLNRSS